MPPATQQRSYAAAHFALSLDGSDPKDIGMLRSIEGGTEKADIMTNAGGGVHGKSKMLGRPKFDDLKLQVGMAMSDGFYDWIANFFTGNSVRKGGAIVAADFYYVERARRNFTEALIKEVTFPKLDGADKNAAYLTVALAVESVSLEPGKAVKLSPPAGAEKQKLWTACNFTFTIDGMGEACSRVTKVDSFTVKQNILEHSVGGFRLPVKLPSQIEYPNISFSVPAVDAAAFHKRFAEQGVRGGPSSNGSDRLHGQLTARDNGGAPLLAMEFFGGEIVSVTPDRMDASSEEISQVRVELFVESMKFTFLAGSPTV
jgi:hypothetical protein